MSRNIGAGDSDDDEQPSQKRLQLEHDVIVIPDSDSDDGHRPKQINAAPESATSRSGIVQAPFAWDAPFPMGVLINGGPGGLGVPLNGPGPVNPNSRFPAALARGPQYGIKPQSLEQKLIEAEAKAARIERDFALYKAAQSAKVAVQHCDEEKLINSFVLSEKRTGINELMVQNRDLQGENDSLVKESRQVRDLVSKHDEEVHSLETKHNEEKGELEDHIEKHDKEVCDLRKQHKAEKRKLEDQNEKHREEKRELEDQIGKHKAEQRKLEDQIEKHDDQVRDLEKQHKAEKRKLEGQMSTHKEETRDAEQTREGEMRYLEDKNRDLKDKVLEVQNALDPRDLELTERGRASDEKDEAYAAHLQALEQKLAATEAELRAAKAVRQ